MKKILPFLLLLYCSLVSVSQNPTDHIRMNQLGYLPYSQKQAAIVDVSATSFQIVDNLGNTVFTNYLGAPATWGASGEAVRIADFSIFNTPGVYTLRVPGYGESYEFEISDTVFTEVNNAIVKAFYFNRASTALLAEHAGIYARPGGHWDTIVIVHPSAAGPTRVAGDTISAPKGWYDAGDYNKYIVNSGVTTGTLLLAYENYANHYDTASWNIPESGNGVPDLLDEIRWNLEWMLTMQDPADGGVYNKTTGASFSGYVMPHVYNMTRYVVAKGTSAALNFAAVMAMAARIYEPYDATFAQTCLTAAEYAWDWAVANPNMPFTNPSAQNGYPAVVTGGYGDNNFSDERIWAASELFITTQKNEYLTLINLNRSFDTQNWRNVEFMALLSLYTHRASIADDVDTAVVKTRIMNKSNELLQIQKNSNPYRVPATTFPWGSNGQMANQGIILLFGYYITGEVDFFNAALSTYDYILGRNATSYSFVTQFGGKNSQNVHHRVSVADGIPGSVPGFLAGGPNGGNKSDCSAPYPTLAAKAYLDLTCSYTTNEIAINWQAPMVYLAHALPVEYRNWLNTLPENFAIPSLSEISLARYDNDKSFSVFANTEWHLLTDDTWYEFSQDTIFSSAFITLSITIPNDGDTIRSGEFYVVIGTDTVSTITISQLGRMKDFVIQAEDYISMVGVQTEPTQDVGGGLNVGYIDNGNSMTYILDISYTGSYKIDYRVASLIAQGELHMRIDGADSVYSLIRPQPTGGWQNWTTLSDTAYFEQGVYEMTLFALFGGFNLNYLEFTFLTEDNIAPIHYPTSIPSTSVDQISHNIIRVQNPVTDNTIRVYGLEADVLYSVSLYSAQGVFVDEFEVSTHTNSIPVNVPRGTYICVIEDARSVVQSVVISVR